MLRLSGVRGSHRDAAVQGHARLARRTVLGREAHDVGARADFEPEACRPAPHHNLALLGRDRLGSGIGGASSPRSLELKVVTRRPALGCAFCNEPPAHSARRRHDLVCACLGTPSHRAARERSVMLQRARTIVRSACWRRARDRHAPTPAGSASVARKPI